MSENENPINNDLVVEQLYNPSSLSDDLYIWRKNLLSVVRTTGSTNYEMLKDNEFFRSYFPFVTSSDKMIINKLLAEIKRLRK